MASPMRDVEVLRAACCVAGLDGEVTENERAVLDRLADNAGVGRVSLEAMIDRARRDQEFYKEQFRVLKADPGETIKALIEVARADGDEHVNERVVIGHFAERLGLSPAQCDAIWERA